MYRIIGIPNISPKFTDNKSTTYNQYNHFPHQKTQHKVQDIQWAKMIDDEEDILF